MSDHERGCQGREYTCTCGYDDERDTLIKTLEEQIVAAREFVKRHPALSLIDLAEFEAFLKLPGILGPRIDAALAAAKEQSQ